MVRPITSFPRVQFKELVSTTGRDKGDWSKMIRYFLSILILLSIAFIAVFRALDICHGTDDKLGRCNLRNGRNFRGIGLLSLFIYSIANNDYTNLVFPYS